MSAFMVKGERMQNIPPVMETSVVYWGGPIRHAFMRRAWKVSKRSIAWRADLISSWYAKLVVVVAENGRGDHAVVDVDEDTKAALTRNCAERQEELVLGVWRIKLWL
jgi:hypothetical protein